MRHDDPTSINLTKTPALALAVTPAPAPAPALTPALTRALAPRYQVPFITNTSWGNPLVETGPPPLPLSSGDLIFFHNSWNAAFPAPPGYQPAWAILSGADPSRIVARATEPLWSPQRAAWLTGQPPAYCNVPNVAFVEAAHATPEPDTFRLYFGGADAVVGTAVVRVELGGLAGGAVVVEEYM